MMSQWLIVLSGLWSIVAPAAGQVFQKTYSSALYGHAWTIASTMDGGAVFAGTLFDPPPNSGLMLVKVDAAGELQWTKTYSAAGTAYRVRQTRDGGFILGGEVPTAGHGNEDALLVRTDADGTPLWSAVYGAAASRERAADVVETADGGFAFVGFTGVGAGPYDPYVVRTDGAGNVVWARRYAGGTARSLLAAADGGFLIVGARDSVAAGADVLVIRTDAAGAPIWSKTYGGPGQDWAVGVVEVAGSYVVAAGTQSFGRGGFDPALFALDSLGNVVWSKVYGTVLSELPMSLVRTGSGDLVVGGWTDGAMPPAFGFALRTDAAGTLRWSRFHASSSFWGVDAADDGGSWMVGHAGAGPEMLVVRANEDGATTCGDPDAGFVTGGMTLLVGNGPASGPGTGTRSAGNLGGFDARLVTTTLCFCEGARRTSYGIGWRGTFGIPALAAFDRPVLGRTVALHAGNSFGAPTPGLLLLGRQPADVTTPFGGTLLVQSDVGLGVAVGVTGAQVALPIPDDTTLCGLSVFLQMLELDGGATRGVSFTPGLQLQFGL